MTKQEDTMAKILSREILYHRDPDGAGWVFDPRFAAQELAAEGWLEMPSQHVIIQEIANYFGVQVPENGYVDEVVTLGDVGHLADSILQAMAREANK